MADRSKEQLYDQVLAAIGEVMQQVVPGGTAYALVYTHSEGPKLIPSRDVKDEIVLYHKVPRKALFDGFDGTEWRYIRHIVRTHIMQGAIT